MGSEAPELMAIKDANLRMQRELFRLAAERDAAVDRYQLAEDRIDDLEGLIRDFRAALGMIDRFRNLPPITDEELDDLEVLWERDTLRAQAYDALRHAQDDLLKAVVD